MICESDLKPNQQPLDGTSSDANYIHHL